MRISILSLLFLLLTNLSDAQKRSGALTAADFKLPSSEVINSNTNAVIISDQGITDFVGNKKGWFSYVFKRKTRIKILNKNAFDLASVKIILHKQDDVTEELKDLSASTYNLVNDQVVETKMEKTDLFVEKLGKYHIEKKFTLPAVVENSIIEYSYTIQSDFIFSLPSWEFQNIDYPTLQSQYELTIPRLLSYTFLTQFPHPLSVDKKKEGHDSYTVTNPRDERSYASREEDLIVQTKTDTYTWIMKDLPAFYVENYLSNANNYIDKIGFQLAAVYNGEDTRNLITNWSSAIDRLLSSEDFAGAIKRDDFLVNELADKATSQSQDRFQSAKDIFAYVKTNFKCTSHNNKYIMTSLRDVIKKGSGGVGEINLLLTAMLRSKGFHADPVILSTRDFGYNYSKFPILDQFNYVIAKTTIDDKVYYLDASLPHLGFGRLSGNCYNGHARVVSKNDTAAVYFLPDSVREQKTTQIFLFNDQNNPGQWNGNFKCLFGYQESYDVRATGSDKKYASDLFDRLQTSGKVELTDYGIDSLRDVEMPLAAHYDFKLKPESTSDHIYFNPFIGFGYTKNPFAAADRKYPVEMPYPIDETFAFYMQIPDGYTVDETPKSMKANFNETEGFFEYLIQKNEKVIQMRTRLKLNKATFAPDEYNTLRDFFSFIVKKQSENIVFKKK